MPGEAILLPAATLDDRTALPFTLEASYAGHDGDLMRTILSRLDRLQAISELSQVELTNLREVNGEILKQVRQPYVTPRPHDPPVREVAGEQKLTVSLIGPFEAWVGDQKVTSWPGRKARLLLAYLALEKGRVVPKDVLIELFWPGARSDRGANNLSIAVHQIRSRLADISPEAAKAVTVRQGLYSIDPEELSVDLWDLQSHLDQARRSLERDDRPALRYHLREAVSLYRGELMASDPYEEWTMEPRRILSASCYQALAWLATEAASQRDWPAVIDFATQILRRDACDENAHRMIVNAHLMMGNRSLALQQYRACVEVLDRELRVQPDAETLRLGKELGLQN